MTPDQVGKVIADRFISGEYTGRDNLAIHISSAIQQALEEAARVADRTAAANSSAASELEFNYPDQREDIQALDRCAATAADIAVAIRALKEKTK